MDDIIAADIINKFSEECHKNANRKGWWDKPRSTLECLALIHSEVSEAVEDVRNGDTTNKYAKDGKPNGLPSELADIVIRVFDLASELKINIGDVIVEKHTYNKTRTHRHGGKLA